MRTCTNCKVDAEERKGQWWYLCGYFGLKHGFFCPDCYEKVSHDPWDKPNHPEEFERIKAKLA